MLAVNGFNIIRYETCFNIISRISYFLLFYLHSPGKYNLKMWLFDKFLRLERIRLFGLEHLVLARADKLH
jgi:hypothetical protein